MDLDTRGITLTPEIQMLDHRPIRLLSGAETDWPCRPLIPGPWRDVPSHITIALAAEGARRSDMRIMLPSPIERMRSLPLEFYPDWYLVEGLSRYAINAAGVFRMLIGLDRLMLLDGTSPPIHALNSSLLRLDNELATDQYLRFFCGVVHGEAGPFSIVERMSMLTLNPVLTPDERAKAKAAVGPMRRGRGGNAELRSAAVVYGTALFRARFRVKPEGKVEMIDDTPVLNNVLERAVTHDGIWEVYEEPADIMQRTA